MYKRLFIIFSLVLFYLGNCFSQQKETFQDTLWINKIKKNWAFDNTFNFINYFDNYIEWKDTSSAKTLFERISNTKNRKFVVLHIGDSHIQSDFYTGFVRNKLNESIGNGGRGFVFPFQAAKTHSAYNYRNRKIGEWQFTRNVLRDNLFDIGLTGATIHTNDTAAGFKIWFPIENLDTCNKLVKIYYKKSPFSFDMVIKCKNYNEIHYVKADTLSEKPFAEIQLNNLPDTLEVTFSRKDTLQNFFECYGVSFENKENTGILYHSVGINGASLRDINAQKLFPSQLITLSPDLVIIDLGTNDLLGNVIMNDVQYELKSLIKKIKTNSPNSIILISTPQDFYKRRKHIPFSKDYAEIAKKIAFENNCLFYNYYNISGGNLIMNKWVKNNIAKKDRIHLTGQGYIFKGQLFLNALLNSSLFYNENPNKSLIVNNEIKKTTKVNFANNENIISYDESAFIAKFKKDTTTYSINTREYKVKRGDNLGSIAAYNDLSIDEIKEINGLKNDKIYEGQILLLKSNKENNTIKKGTSINTNKPQQKTRIKNHSGNKKTIK